MKVLASRRLPGDAFDELDDVEVIALTGLTQARPDVEAVIVANEAVPLDLLPALRLVANFGVGVDRIDLDTCARRGIAVTTTPGALDDATADLTFALMLATRRRVVEGDRLVRSGGWPGTGTASRVAEEVTGATLGIVGLGRIGTAVAERARGFRMRVLYAQPRRRDTDLAEYHDLDEMLPLVDILTVHAPLSEATRGLLDARRLALVPDGACVINAARGEIIDEAGAGRRVRLRPAAGRTRRVRPRAVPAGRAPRPVQCGTHAAPGQRHPADPAGHDASRRGQRARGRARPAPSHALRCLTNSASSRFVASRPRGRSPGHRARRLSASPARSGKK